MTHNPQAAFAPGDAGRFAAAIRRIDAANSRDPRTITADGVSRPQELVYSEWLSDWVLRLAPDASEPLRLAARCQHLCRWEIPRDSYPPTRAGYLRWRQDLKVFHAGKSAEILREAGYDEQTIQKVRDLNLKQNFPADPECRTLEDALCLVFLERQFSDLAAKATEEKVVAALQKCWVKMTPQARERALRLSYTGPQKHLLARALDPSGSS